MDTRESGGFPKIKIRHIDHLGIVVNDLAAAKSFFVDLGFTEVGGYACARRMGGANHRA